ncbi:hypothetical protein COT62_02360 [Candidatus Roizmanbacteria bacterium CG09_land_8_20_14_0_10_41_9]|uniref:Glycosyl transferase family 1 domain-containing protein n=1 Tax=Candidatus Roizmanbacteria bacterium CG09_land_8_20_14_0_10_41_9 TaxID=1974850 RepID=A0A2H0WUV6_9BACT|nr:MAG: hypothetical protein COT62_02360 [Candidatus Roizmanbacteria bacterium CG09_land_8_20_14_0_10_41_9]
MKILINGISEDGGHYQVPWMLKFKRFFELGWSITFFGNRRYRDKLWCYPFFKKYRYGFIELKHTSPIPNHKFRFMVELLRRNIVSFFYVFSIRNQYDVVYSPASVLDLILFPYVLKKIDKRIKWVAVFDNIVPLRDPGNKLTRFLAWLFFRISLVLLKDADLVFAISPDLKVFLLESGFQKNKVVVTGNGLDVDLLKLAKKEADWNMDALYVGRINETKGIYDLLGVLQIVKKTYPHFQLGIMGNGDEITQRQFKRKIREMELEKNTQLLGYVTGGKKFNMIKSSKCFLFLSKSKSESFGVALLEAVCLGLPAIAYDLPSYKNIYKHKEIFTFKVGDTQSVAGKIIEIFREKKFTNNKGKLLQKKYSWKKIADMEFHSIHHMVYLSYNN